MLMMHCDLWFEMQNLQFCLLVDSHDILFWFRHDMISVSLKRETL
jgi:hypothetical protein